MSVRSNRVPRQSLRRIFAWPAVIAVTSIIGLILGLTGDGWRDWAAWILLVPPLIAALVAWLRRIRPLLKT